MGPNPNRGILLGLGSESQQVNIKFTWENAWCSKPKLRLVYFPNHRKSGTFTFILHGHNSVTLLSVYHWQRSILTSCESANHLGVSVKDIFIAVYDALGNTIGAEGAPYCSSRKCSGGRKHSTYWYYNAIYHICAMCVGHSILVTPSQFGVWGKFLNDFLLIVQL